MIRSKTRALAELTLAGALWGLGFVATVWALQSFSPQTTLVARFSIATALGLSLSLGILTQNRAWKNDLRLALPAGLILATVLFLQTVGLQYTTATKSGFLTCLYVVLVPLFHALFSRRSPSLKTWLWVLTALAGIYLLVGGHLDALSQGDLWMLGSAVGSAAHIIYIGKASKHVQNSFLFNNFQSLWCLLALTPPWLLDTSTRNPSPSPLSLAGLVILGAGASLIAFSLQIRAQKVLSDTTASMLFLLESPFAAFFGFLLLQERLDLHQSFGALIIITAAAGHILTDKRP